MIYLLQELQLLDWQSKLSVSVVRLLLRVLNLESAQRQWTAEGAEQSQAKIREQVLYRFRDSVSA